MKVTFREIWGQASIFNYEKDILVALLVSISKFPGKSGD